jgi:hypothetical protein
MFTRVKLPYHLDSTAFAGEVRVRATAAAAVVVRLVVGVLEGLPDESTAELTWLSPSEIWNWRFGDEAKYADVTRRRWTFRAVVRARAGMRFLAKLRGRARRRVRV